jgi:diadenosine tetraphosphate (Ap4A) HIT family hydrolase
MNCLFFELEEIKKRVIIKNKHAFVFPTNIPIVPGHLLICPNRCVATINDLTNEELKIYC